MPTTKEIQTRLILLGYPLPKFGADGFMGAETASALRAFQGAVGVPVTGVADTATLAKLFPVTITGTKAAAVIAKQPKAVRTINEIIVHCTATPEGRDVSVDTIRGWHKAQGWKDIGYHYVVKLDGSLEPGRPEANIGSHVAGHNTNTLGLVYVGGVAANGTTPKDTRTPAQKAMLMEAAKALIAKYPAIHKITGHNQYAAKACPSFNVQTDPLGSLV